MTSTRQAGSAMRLTLAATAALSLAACAHHPKPAYPTTAPPPSREAPPPSRPNTAPPPAAVSEAALPGSEKDFVVNVGDRVYFDYDMYNI
ncbi:MAG: peptidoglycan-associated lipoprotein, partial [Proteobacteria bacterium]|nr:peptidoglycan-associated lipoprotein [Pseudomonadota bacterium]